MPMDQMTPSAFASIVGQVENRDAGAPGGELAMTGRAGVPLRLLNARHPDYDAGYWHVLDALYAGGKKLLKDKSVMREVFPRHRNEHQAVYDERCARAFYTPYAGEIVDFLVSQLCEKSLSMRLKGEDGDTEEPDEFYMELHGDVSPPGGRVMTLQNLLREQVKCALRKRTAWVLVDLPIAAEYGSQLEQERAGGLDPYVVHYEPECVINWEFDDDGELRFATVYTVDARQSSIHEARGATLHTWVYYTRDGWQKYAIRVPAGQVLDDNMTIPLVDAGDHTFGGRVPLLRFEVPDGLWAMEKLEGMAREHFNKRTALSWAETQSLLPELYEFLGPEVSRGSVVPANQADAGRATAETRGQGYVQQRGAGDMATFVGPSAEPFKYAAESCKSLRDEMHRVTHVMALTVENNSAALRRSAESKGEDKSSTAVVLNALGGYVREHAVRIFQLISLGRGEDDLAPEWVAEGMDEYDGVVVQAVVDQALLVDQLRIESPTFRRRHRFAVCRTVLGEGATKEDLETIREELEANITEECFTDPLVKAAELAAGAAAAEEAAGDDPDDPDDEEDAPPVMKKKPAGRQAMIDTRK